MEFHAVVLVGCIIRQLVEVVIGMKKGSINLAVLFSEEDLSQSSIRLCRGRRKEKLISSWHDRQEGRRDKTNNHSGRRNSPEAPKKCRLHCISCSTVVSSYSRAIVGSITMGLQSATPVDLGRCPVCHV